MMHSPFIAHSVIRYLPMSENWIYTQMAGLKRFRPLVLTKRAENLDYFPLEPVGGVVIEAYSDNWNRIYQKLCRKWLTCHYPAYSKALKRYPSLLLHSHFAQHGYDDMQLAEQAGLPHIVSCYGADVWRLGITEEWQAKYQQLFSRVDQFFVEGNAMKKRMIELGCDAEKIKVHHLGVILDKIQYTPRKPDSDGTVRCLMAGRAIEKKGMLYGLQAFVNLAPRYKNLKLTIMTWGESAYKQKLIAELKDLAERAGVDDRITWYGLQPYHEYIRITESSHIFLVPSVMAKNGDAEGGCPVTAIELSASGMPIVGFSHCDIPEVVLDGQSGYLAPEKDVEALTVQLERVVTNPENWIEMGQIGRNHIEAEYNGLIQVERQEELYAQLIEQHSS